MSKKTSATKKANYGRYQSESRADVNKTAKINRHMKTHENDLQSKGRKPSTCAGKTNVKRSKFEAALKRAVRHELLFGQPKKAHTSGRDLRSTVSQNAFANTPYLKSAA